MSIRNHQGPPRPAPGELCIECEQPHITHRGGQSCMGHVRFNRDPESPDYRARLPKPRACGQYPVKGLDRCHMHGAGNPRAAEAGRRKVREAKMKKLMLTLGEPVEGVDPGEVITERIAARLGHVRWLLARVQALEPDALTWGRTKQVEGDVVVGNGPSASLDRASTSTDEAKPNVWYALYIDASDKLEHLCIEAIRVGLDERRVRIDERMADMWVGVIDGMLRELGHDPNDPATANVVARHLALVA